MAGVRTYAANLLPEELREQPPDLRRLVRIAILVTTVIALACVSLGLSWQIQASQARAARLEVDLQQLQPQVDQVDRLLDEVEGFQQESEALSSLGQRDILWYDLLRKIGNSTPPNTWFTDMATGKDGQTLTLSGMTPEPEDVGLFMQAASTVPEVTGLRLLSLEQVEQGGIRLVAFKIEASLKREVRPAAGGEPAGEGGSGGEKRPATGNAAPEAGGEQGAGPGG